MPISLPPWLRAHWFIFAAASIVAWNWLALPGVRADLPRLAEPAALFDLAVLLPALYWLSYRHRRKDAGLRALALSCLGVWAVSKLLPQSEQQLLVYLTPLRYVGLAVLVAIELKIVLALYRTVFSGATRDAAAQVQSQADLPPWLSRLLVADCMKRRKLATRALPAVLLLATLLASAPAVHACGLENPSSVNVGLLNLAYPNALHVRTAVWIAQRDGVLAPFDAAAMVEPQSPDFVLRQMALLREIRGQFVALKADMDAGGARAVPSFSVVLLGIVLWTRFEAGDAALNMTVHAPGPGSEDVVIVTDAPVIAALAAGRLTPAEARRRGLMRAYGTAQGVQSVERFWDGVASVKGAAAERFVATTTDRMQTD